MSHELAHRNVRIRFPVLSSAPEVSVSAPCWTSQRWITLLVHAQEVGDGGNRVALSREQEGVAAAHEIGVGAGTICPRHPLPCLH